MGGVAEVIIAAARHKNRRHPAERNLTKDPRNPLPPLTTTRRFCQKPMEHPFQSTMIATNSLKCTRGCHPSFSRAFVLSAIRVFTSRGRKYRSEIFTYFFPVALGVGKRFLDKFLDGVGFACPDDDIVGLVLLKHFPDGFDVFRSIAQSR